MTDELTQADAPSDGSALDSDEPQVPKPEAFQVAFLDFCGAYGGEPDLTDSTDVYLFLELLEREVRRRVDREILSAFGPAI